MKVGVLFDLDGTLLETLQDLYTATNHVLRQFGCPERSFEQVRQYVGNGARRLIELALPGKADDPSVEEVLTAFQQHYNAVCAQGTAAPYAGVPAALKALREKYPVAVVSNKPDPAVKALCRVHFGDMYAIGVTPTLDRKPAPDMVKKAMADMGVDTCVFVGDSEVDVLTAKNAGVPCVSVLWGFRTRQELEQAGATCYCERTEDLPELVEKLAKSLEG